MFSVFGRIEDNFSGSILKEMILVIFYKLCIWDNFVSSEKKKHLLSAHCVPREDRRVILDKINNNTKITCIQGVYII